MAKELSKLQIAQQEAEVVAQKTNQKINELGQYTNDLYASLNTIQSLFDLIRNVPEKNKLKYEKLKAIRVSWKQQAEKIEMEYKKAEMKTAGQGVAGVGAGIAVAALGPTAAMGVATTFGVASTGTAISALSGAAATSAALAWLGGGALAAGGGGMAAGSAFLALAGPVGWTIAGVSALASGLLFFKSKSDKERLENIYTLISERDIKSYELAIVEINERIKRIIDETSKLENAIARIESFGTDYSIMSENQQYELGTYVNIMEASTMLLVNPILGLQPKYTEEDFEKLCSSEEHIINHYYFIGHKNLIISMANLLYKIKLDNKDKKLLTKSLKKNKEFLSSMGMSKKEFDINDIMMIESALNHSYKSRTY
ncbi:hypothetical protein B5E87_00870 [Massilimicrobiota sp. An142]|uniref:hypothetical protein n=1 Tax=Massilimicrobiota sp. An142 TaxID=1965564 RepID=UPI000B381763|nr:hypothetical protein [Massilimicrobiota sp. An142]OUQ15139.1 hypothetical protein B5E87_00870 [Massilimicrobiota sp. An142]